MNELERLRSLERLHVLDSEPEREFNSLVQAAALVCGVPISPETAAVTNLSDAARFVEQAHELGIRISLDDFGAGASSFRHLKSLAVDYLKIDGQFIKGLIDDRLDDAAVRCFVDVAGVTGIRTVAEFADHPSLLARVRELGIDFVQGCFVHRPEPLDTVLSATARELTSSG